MLDAQRFHAISHFYLSIVGEKPGGINLPLYYVHRQTLPLFWNGSVLDCYLRAHFSKDSKKTLGEDVKLSSSKPIEQLVGHQHMLQI